MVKKKASCIELLIKKLSRAAGPIALTESIIFLFLLLTNAVISATAILLELGNKLSSNTVISDLFNWLVKKLLSAGVSTMLSVLCRPIMLLITGFDNSFNCLFSTPSKG